MFERRRHFLIWFWPPPAIAIRLWPTVLAAAAYTAMVFAICERFELGHPAWADEVGALNALVVGVLVGFRTKAAYDRWWEARILWGDLTNQSRNLCLKAEAYVKLTAEDRRELAELVGAFAAALMTHLRATSASANHEPARIAGRVIALIASWRTAGTLDGHCHQMLDLHASALMNVCGSCERIRSTPLPGSFLSLLRHGLLLGFLSAPWHLSVSLGWWAIPAQAVLVYFLFGVELTAEEVEQPFAYDPDDLPLERFCETIARSAKEILKVE